MSFLDDLRSMVQQAKAAYEVNTGASKPPALQTQRNPSRPPYAGPRGINSSGLGLTLSDRARAAQYSNEAKIAAERGEARERAQYEKAGKPYPGFNKGTSGFGMQFDAPGNSVGRGATSQEAEQSKNYDAIRNRDRAFLNTYKANQAPLLSPLDRSRASVAAAKENAAQEEALYNKGRGAKTLREFTDTIAQGFMFPDTGGSGPVRMEQQDVAEREATAARLANEWYRDYTGPGNPIRNEFIAQNTPDVFDVNAPNPFHLTASGDLAVGPLAPVDPSPASAARAAELDARAVGGSSTVAGLPASSIRAIEEAQDPEPPRFTESGVPIKYVDFTQRAGKGGRAPTLFNERDHNSARERLGDRPAPDFNDAISSSFAALLGGSAGGPKPSSGGGSKNPPASAGGESNKTKNAEGPEKPFLERDLPDFNQMKMDFLQQQGRNLAGRYSDAFNYAKDGLLDEDLSHGERLGRILSAGSLSPALGLNEQAAAINSVILPDTDAWGNIFSGDATWGDGLSAGLDVLSIVPGLGALKLAKTGKLVGKAGTGTRIAPKAPTGSRVAPPPRLTKADGVGYRTKGAKPKPVKEPKAPKPDKAPKEPKLTKADKPPKESTGKLKKATKFTAATTAIGGGVYGAGLLANKLNKDGDSGPPTSTGAGETIFDEDGREYWFSDNGWMVSDGRGGWQGVNAEQQAALDAFGASSGGTYVRHAGG